MGQLADMNAFNEAALSAAKILVVDDEPDIVEEVVEYLEDEGLKCVSAHTAAEAMDLVKEDLEIGVVVTDIRMPGMDGLEMARQLHRDYGKDRELFVIVVTGHAGMKEAIEALQLGAEDFLTKPISPDHLLHSVRRAEEMIHLRANERLYQNHLEREVRVRTAEARRLADDLADRNEELERKNRELTIVNRLKDEFLQMMSHELNTPLNAIIGFSQLLLDGGADKGGEKCEKCASHIYSAGMQLTRTVDSILTLSSISAGDLRPDYSSFTAGNFADSIAADFTNKLNEFDAGLRCEVPGQAFDINADFALLQKAVGYLLENAAKYGGHGCKVSMTMNREDDLVRINISDDGPGMTAEQAAVALEPMRQIDGSVSRRYEGMGLGLPLARGIVELHGGHLEIDSTPGEGTTVTLTVPVGQAS